MVDRIAIVDYGMGNLRSVANALHKLKMAADIVADPTSISGYDRVILPGVGAFAEAIVHLRSSGMAQALNEFVATGKPLLGVCLGMQLICSRSYEDGAHEGLGWIKADVVPIPPSSGLKIPHMGWNEVRPVKAHPVLAGLEAGGDAYFVHSYHVVPEDCGDVLAVTSYGEDIVSIVGRDNITGMQFHPEKSQAVGIQLIENFTRL